MVYKTMRKLLFLATLFSLIACSTTNNGMKYVNKSPRGISILNIIKEMRSKAYQTAESHCAKYNKVPRVLKSIIQEQEDESQVQMTTMTFECVRPNY